MITLLSNELDFIVVDKPAGIAMESDEHGEGIVEILCKQLAYPVWPAHRLDKITSGLLLLAKNKTALGYLSSLFEARQVTKYYLAISARKPKKKQGRVKGDMMSARRGSWRLTQACNKPAITHFFSEHLSCGHRGFIIKPTTGKTHQIRVALKSLGSPILGDKRYAGEASDRVYLHAYGLAFNYQGQRYDYWCEPTVGQLFKDLPQSLLQAASKPWPKP